MRFLGAVAAAVLAAAVASPVTAAPAPPAVAGRTEIVAPAGSARMAVRVPRTVTFPSGYLQVPFVTVSGTADVVVVYLVPRQRPLLQPAVVFGRLGRGVGHPTFAGYHDRLERVTAGTYDLVVVHTPGTAKVTLTFPGLAGRTTLRPVARSAAVLKPLSVAPVAPGTYAPVASTGGADAPLAANGFVQVLGALRAEVGSASRVVTCLRPPDTVTPPPVAYAPECPGLRTVAHVVTGGTVRYFNTTFLNWDKGTYGAGFAYEGAVVPTAVGGVAAFVPLP